MNPRASVSDRAGMLYKAGYGPVPIKTGHKAPPAGGFTGERAPDLPSYADWLAFVDQFPGYMNLGVRLPQGTVGIDVDSYKPAGLASFRALNGAQWPQTILVTSREYTGIESPGIRLFRLPEGVDQSTLVGALSGIETIRFGHRYLMAPGSDHPSGQPYRAIDQRTGEILEHLPGIEQLPVIPTSQLAPLRRGPAHRTRDAGRQPADQPSGLQDPGGEACWRVSAATVCDWAAGSRYDTMRDRVWELICLDNEGHSGARQALSELAESYLAELVQHPREGGDPRGELERAVSGALAKMGPAQAGPCQCNLGASFEWADPAQDEIWSARPLTEATLALARSAMISPWALLGCTLARISAEVPPWVVLPAVVGAESSLNLYVALVGPPASGKTAAVSVSRGMANLFSQLTSGWTAPAGGLGSGEGLARTYANNVLEKDEETGAKVWRMHWTTTRALFVSDEIGIVESLTGRSGQTLGPMVRTAWMGADLSLSYADQTKRINLPAHSYRMALIVGAQPGRVEFLTSEADAGTPQRYLWCSAVDPNADPGWAPYVVPTLGWLPPEILNPSDGRTREWGDRMEMVFPTGVAQAIRERRARQVRGEDDAPRQHADLQQMKVAALLGIADGRLTVEDADWELAERIIDHSQSQYDKLLEHQRRQRRASNEARGQALAEVEEAASEARLDKVRKAVLRILERHGQNPPPNHPDAGCPTRCLRGVRVPAGWSHRDALRAALGDAARLGEAYSMSLPTGGAAGGSAVYWRATKL